MVDDMFTMAKGIWSLGAASLLAWVGALTVPPRPEVLPPVTELAIAPLKIAAAAEPTPPSTPAPLFASSPASAVEPAMSPSGFPTVKAMLALDQPIDHGEYAWADEKAGAGEVWILVDISTQTLHAFRGDAEIGRAVVLYGADNKPTPLGRFTITQKRRHHVSNLYHVEMPFMMRLTDDGIAIHASDVEQDAATRGCIGLPTDFAELLFAETRVGTRVLVVNGNAFNADVAA